MIVDVIHQSLESNMLVLERNSEKVLKAFRTVKEIRGAKQN